MHIAEKKKYTEKDYQLLEEGAPFQLINGDLIMSPSPILLHQLIVGKLYNLISNFIEKNSVSFVPLCLDTFELSPSRIIRTPPLLSPS